MGKIKRGIDKVLKLFVKVLIKPQDFRLITTL